MNAALIALVWSRAGNACEYCLMPQIFYPATYPIDHVITIHHDGATVAENLALSCLHCNSHQGPNIAGRDKITRKLTPLYRPRRHRGPWHFRWHGPLIVGRTASGRVTVAVLNMNGE